MHYSGENMHKTILFLHKSEKYAKQWKFGLCICVKMYILSIKMCKEHEEGIVYLCHVTRVRDKDCVKNRVKRAKIVRFTLC